MKALVVLLTQHFGLVVQVTMAFIQPGDIMPKAENKAIPFLTTLNSGIDNGMMRRVVVIIKMNRRLPATTAREMRSYTSLWICK
jgi:hypothetical protein